MAIAQDCIDSIKERVDIVAEIGRAVDLKKAGSNFVGLCPFHGENTPSFNVSPAKKFFHCFGCGKSGDAVAFLMDFQGMDFPEAIGDLGERLGIVVATDAPTPSPQQRQAAQAKRGENEAIEEALELARRFYIDCMTLSDGVTNSAGGNYAKSRGLDDVVHNAFGFGYAPASDELLSAMAWPEPAKMSTSILLKAGLLVERVQPDGSKVLRNKFRDRLMFPIRDTRGKVVGFGGRIINNNRPDAPKYLNSPESSVFMKHKLIYGLHEARAGIRNAGQIFVTEGYTDVISMAKHGLTNTVATMGTALTEDHVRLLLRFADRLCLMFDGDAPGRAAAWKAVSILLPQMEARHEVTFLTLPDGKDPDDFLKAHGAQTLRDLAAKAPSLTQYLLAHLLGKYGSEGRLTSLESRARFTEEAKTLVQLMPPKNPVREMLQREVDLLTGYRPPGGMNARELLRQSIRQRDGFRNERFGGAEGRVYSGGYESPRTPVVVSGPALKQLSLWERLYAAARIAPDKALAVAGELIPMLDEEDLGELRLLQHLDRLQAEGASDVSAEPASLDQQRSASDLLTNARQLVGKLRRTQVREELNAMLSSRQISQEEYINQMSALKPG